MRLQLLDQNSPSDSTMSSREIAKLTGKEHKNVTRDIVNILAEVGTDALSYERTYLDPQNRGQKEYLLPRFECDLVMSGYSVKYRAAIIKRWHELERLVARAKDIETPYRALTRAGVAQTHMACHRVIMRAIHYTDRDLEEFNRVMSCFVSQIHHIAGMEPTGTSSRGKPYYNGTRDIAISAELVSLSELQHVVGIYGRNLLEDNPMMEASTLVSMMLDRARLIVEEKRGLLSKLTLVG